MSDITPLLLDAKKEYTQRLQEIVEPQISSTLIELYEKSGYDDYEFQMALRQIPYWNSTIVNTKTQYFMTQFPYFDNIVAAVIVTYVKVLSAIRLGDKPNVKLQLPKTEDFVHELYKQVARIVYYAPETIRTHEGIMIAVGDAIENSIRRLIPYDSILESYLAAPDPVPAQTAPQDDSSSESESDSESDEDNDDIQIPMPQQYSTAQPPVQPPPMSDQPPSYDDDADTGDDGGDDDDVDDDHAQFMPPAAYPAPPPQAMPSVAPPQQQTGPAMHPTAIAQQTAPPPVTTSAPQQQLFGSAQIRSGF